MQVEREKIVTVNEALELLKQRQREGNLSYEQQNTLNYLEDLVKLDDKDAAKLLKELKEVGLTEWQAVKIADLLPKKEDELKVILVGSGSVNDASLKKAFDIVKEYKKSAKEPAKSRKIEPLPEKPVVDKTEKEEPGAEKAESQKEEPTN